MIRRVTSPLSTKTGRMPSPEAGENAPWWKGAVIYQIYPRSFCDSNGDGIGDLPGITAHLDYVAELGVDGIWLSPFFTSPMRDFGYDISNYCDVDPVFGTLADFDALIARAHRLGLKVIIDQVYSHTSDLHPWFVNSRSDRCGSQSDWYVWADPKRDGSPPNNWQSVFGGPAWTWCGRRRQYYFHNFLSTQPDLNVRNPAVQDALFDAARFWLRRGVDGFRLDALNFSMHDLELRDNPPMPDGIGPRNRPFDFQVKVYNQSRPEIVDFVARLSSVIRAEKPDAFAVAEIGGPNPIEEMKAFTHGDDRLHSAYNFDFLYAPDLSPERVRTSLNQWTDTPGEGWPSWAFSNHDAPRAVTRWADGRDPTRIAKTNLMLLLCLRGSIFIYQGEELGLAHVDVPFDRLQDAEAIANWPLTLGRDGARTPMPWAADRPFLGFSTMEPWLPVADEHRKAAVDRQRGVTDSVLEFSRRLIALRRTSAALRLGRLEFPDTKNEPGLLLINRDHRQQGITAIFNLGRDTIRSPLSPDRPTLISNGLTADNMLLPGGGLIAERA